MKSIKKYLFLFILFTLVSPVMVHANLHYVGCGTAEGIPQPLVQMTRMLYTFLVVITPIILVATSVFTMVKAIKEDNADEIKKAKDKLVKKFIAAAIILLIGVIARFVLLQVVTNADDKSTALSCMKCFLYNADCHASDSGNNVKKGYYYPEPDSDFINDTESNRSNYQPRSSSNSNSNNPDSGSNIMPTNPGLGTGKYGSLEYYLYVPSNVDSNKPLVIYLHGSAEFGGSLSNLDAYGFTKHIKDGENYNFYMLMPLAPNAGKSWPDYDTDLMGLINEVVSKHNISKNRITLTGFSMGANGTTSYIINHPGTFRNAAIFAYCASAPSSVESFKDVNTWLLVGSADGSCGTNLTNNLYNKLNSAGYKVKLTTYQGIGHNGTLIEKAISDSSFLEFLVS